MELPLETTYDLPLELPIDIWRAIALVSPAAYHALVRSIKGLGQNTDASKRHFTTRRLGVKGGQLNRIKGWRLPNGMLHICPDGGPSITANDGSKLWYVDGQLHSTLDEPAEITANGTMFWYHRGQIHRDSRSVGIANLAGNDLPAVCATSGAYYWYQHGKLHRDNRSSTSGLGPGSPAVINSISIKYYFCGKLHRAGDQPADITPGYKKYYSHGKLIKTESNTREDFMREYTLAISTM
jgi:hypothetical protein